jgi:broad specificity phosphatase PhoE
MELILVRHGQSQYNVDQTGGIDAPLTELGRMQARRVGAYLAAKFEVDTLYASSLSRARETAEIINAFLGLPLQLVPEFREAESDYGDGLVLFDNPLAALANTTLVRPSDVSEYYEMFAERIRHALLSILRRPADPDSQIAIVSHGGTMGTIIRALAGSHQFSIHTENTGIHLLHWERNRWHIVALNRVEHLLSEQDLVTIPAQREHRRE